MWFKTFEVVLAMHEISIGCVTWHLEGFWLMYHTWLLCQIMRRKKKTVFFHSSLNYNWWGDWLTKVLWVFLQWHLWRVYIVGSQVGSQKSTWEVWKGGWEGSKQEVQTKGNCWCKLMPFLSDIDKFLLLFKQSKLFSFWFCFLFLFSCCLENMSGI